MDADIKLVKYENAKGKGYYSLFQEPLAIENKHASTISKSAKVSVISKVGLRRGKCVDVGLLERGNQGSLQKKGSFVNNKKMFLN